MSGFGIWHGSHQQPQSEGYQGASLLSFWFRKVEGDPKENGTCGYWEGLGQRRVGGAVVTNENVHEAGEEMGKISIFLI